MLIKQLLTGNLVRTVLFEHLGRIHQIHIFRSPAISYGANNLVDSTISTEPKCIQLACFNISFPGLVIFGHSPITSAQTKLKVGVTSINFGSGQIEFRRLGIIAGLFSVYPLLVNIIPLFLLRLSYIRPMQAGKRRTIFQVTAYRTKNYPGSTLTGNAANILEVSLEMLVDGLQTGVIGSYLLFEKQLHSMPNFWGILLISR